MDSRYRRENREFFVKILELGEMECDRYRMVRTEDRTARLRVPIMALLIHHPDLGNVVYDTGIGENWQQELFEDSKKNFPVRWCRGLADALGEEGLTPGDIDLLIMSHLHFDHAGGLRDFAGTPAGSHVMVGRKEYERACRAVEDPATTAYVRAHFQVPGIRYELLESETGLYGEALADPRQDDLAVCELAPDFRIVTLTSHSPALLGLLLEIPGKRPLLCVSDAVYTKENYDTELPPASPNKANAAGFEENLRCLKRIRKEMDAEILFGHDLDEMKRIREIYEV